MDLVRDLLDKLVVDRNGREMGRVDSVVLEFRGAAPPRVAGIELGPAALAQRVWPFLGRAVAGLEHALGIDRGRPVRIPFRDILGITRQVKVDRAFGETAASTVELRLRRLVSSIPGASR
jgi:sporulation protein YlmC with PRC-barrel domain